MNTCCHDRNDHGNHPSYSNNNRHDKENNRRLRKKRVNRMLLLLQQLVLIFALVITETTAQSAPYHIRINGGGPLIIDTDNNNARWESDTIYNVENKGNRRNICGSQPNIVIQNNRPLAKVPASVYCSQRNYNQNNIFTIPPFQYNIPVPENNQYYLVKLHFVEMVSNATNARIMDFYIEDELVLNDFDVFDAAGGLFRVHIVTTAQPIFITDGDVTITMSASTNSVIISAVEVIASANLVVHRINCGATSRIPVLMDQESWIRDAYALSGAVSNRCGTTITNSIYCSSRYFSTAIGTPLRYSIPVPYNNALYAVRLHFNEQHHNLIGERVFNVLVQNSKVLKNFDIIRDAPGKNTPMVVSVPKTFYITDSIIAIDFEEITENPHINGIEIIYIGPPLSPPTAPISSPLPAPVKAPIKLPTVAPITSTAGNVIHRINCGSANQVIASNKDVWSPDQYSTVGMSYNTCGTISTSIYCTSRYYRTTDLAPHRYNLPIAESNRLYTVRLHFAEQYHKKVNARLFDIYIEGTLVADDFDIYDSASGGDVPYILTFSTFVRDGTITIEFVRNTDNPQINGIEVLAGGAPITVSTKAPVKPPVKLPTKAPIAPTSGNIVHRINCGSTSQVIVPPNNIVWTPDQYSTSGLAYSTCGTVSTSIYCTSRYFRTADAVPHRYNLPVSTNKRTYTVRLHFAEQYHQRVNARLFDVFVEGVLVVDNLDIYAMAPGGNVPYVVTLSTFVADGAITIDLVRNINNPQLNGIEVFDDGAPIPAPTVAPRALPPNSAPVPSGTPFQDIVINCGGPLYEEQSGLRQWSADTYFEDGSTYSISNIEVMNTVDDPIYQSERVGTFSYSIPVPVGTYEINIHLAELAFTSPNIRKFNLTVESQVFDLVDIFALAGGTAKAVTLGATVLVDDGFVSISVAKVNSEPKMNGIEIKKSLPHVAHSVSNGPYFAVDSSNVGSARVNVDGSESHTHGTDLVLNQWTWKKGAQIIGTGEITNFNLPVGTHDITLTVVDSGSFQATEATTVTVHPFGYPDITTLSPSSGSTVGGEAVTIRGTGFSYSTSNTIVYFGTDQFTGSAIQIINPTTIKVFSPQIPISVPVLVSVQTPLGRSRDATFTYVSSTPISFSTTKLRDITQPTSAEFGPDGKLYVGSLKGTLAKITLNSDYTSVVSIVSAVVQPDRAILGIAFDPMDAGDALPPVYISSSFLFHGERKSSSGTAINGKINRIRGANLDIIEDVITGLPVCDLDHAINQIQFGNNGELYINSGSNTNGGEPGRLSGSGRMKENYFSASTIMANLSHPLFDGFIEYDALDDGSPINYFGISVFAPGLRNPFGLILHSNGYLYATDNGPNTGYGKMKVGCGPSDLLADQQREDKLVRLIKNKYYGHPNPKRAAYHNDPRQCVWRNPTEPTSNNYQAPLGVVLSAATGIIEYQADHFNRQLRGNLIHVKYKGSLLRTVLSPDGLSANPLTIPGLTLLGRSGLDVTQAPNGNLIEVRYTANSIYVSRPIETITAAIRVSAVFPTRGGVAGGTRLRIYGWNFGTTSSDVSITIGGTSCPIVGLVIQTNFIQCTIPGKSEGVYDIVATAIAGSYTFEKGYRYIKGGT